MKTYRITEKDIKDLPVLATGYKIFNNDWTANSGYDYKDENGNVVGTIHKVDGNIVECKWGLHFSEKPLNEYGVMGAGIAGQIRKKFPEVYLYYRAMVNIWNKQGICFSGKLLIVERSYKKYIANCFTQKSGKTDYGALLMVVDKLRERAIFNGYKTVGIPYKYGCGIARGDWETVEKIWTEAFKDSEIELQIWKLK